ncbi:sensor domain-containing protein [Saccharopolyspora erythraea]|uniref:sensor histidine kinase n=1 Tax=Saccharopolyspora erythraea TaxID=1836 RepID=UPI001BA7CFBD|nr:sensor histidine kinase [Saccharopolyspora erythraea]QUH05078.1 sensor domain-containing protein [Saccharopolyspora erythraea]
MATDLRRGFPAPRRALADGNFLLPGLFSGLTALLAIPLVLFAGVSVALGIGFFLLPVGTEAIHRWAQWERQRAGRFLGVPVVTGPAPSGFAAVVRAPSTWRHLLWLPVHGVTGTLSALLAFAGLVAAPVTVVSMLIWPLIPGGVSLLGVRSTSWPVVLVTGTAQLVVALVLLLWGVPALARGQARATLALLSPSRRRATEERLAARVDELAQTREGAVEAHGAELRRIERDLHDGAQAQLVALAMRLGVAEKALRDDPETAARLLREARDGAEEAMTGLREVVRTIYPPILADRGLSGAVSALGSRCAVPTAIRAEGLGDVPAAVEAAAYFVVAEALSNVTKHAVATRAYATLTRVGEDLRVEVGDDGVGGADESRGSGIAGIRHRVAALDGTTSVHSPDDGTTTIRVSLPCGS